MARGFRDSSEIVKVLRAYSRQEPFSTMHQNFRQLFVSEAIEAGYDGVKQFDYRMADDVVWCVFRSNQIKSAIANIGTFDPRNPDIRF